MRHAFKMMKNIPIQLMHGLFGLYTHISRASSFFRGFVGAPPEITCTVETVGDGLNGFDAALYAVSTRAGERVGHPLERNLQLQH